MTITESCRISGLINLSLISLLLQIALPWFFCHVLFEVMRQEICAYMRMRMIILYITCNYQSTVIIQYLGIVLMTKAWMSLCVYSHNIFENA